MRPHRVRGMRPTDRHILEFLANDPADPIVASPVVIAANIDYAKGSVRERMTPLREATLVRYANQESGIYEITDLGLRYLSGELSENEIDDLENTLDSS